VHVGLGWYFFTVIVANCRYVQVYKRGRWLQKYTMPCRSVLVVTVFIVFNREIVDFAVL
jgi:hypothetical protein